MLATAFPFHTTTVKSLAPLKNILPHFSDRAKFHSAEVALSFQFTTSSPEEYAPSPPPCSIIPASHLPSYVPLQPGLAFCHAKQKMNATPTRSIAPPGHQLANFTVPVTRPVKTRLSGRPRPSLSCCPFSGHVFSGDLLPPSPLSFI